MQARGKLPYADFFRALAIFYVLLAHAGGLAQEPFIFHHVALSEAVSIFDGVAMLFCLSGFLLAGPLLRAYLETPAALPPVRPYLLARLLRIYPLYAAAVLGIAAYLTLAGTPPSVTDVALHLAMLQNFSPETIQSLSGPLWTMPLDVQFYLVLPLCFALIARGMRERSERARIIALCVALGGVIVCSVVYRFAVVWHWAPAGLSDQMFIVDQLPGMAALFACGIGARLAVMLFDRSGVHPAGTFVATLVVAAVACRWLQYGAHGAWLHLAAGNGHVRPAIFASVDEAIGGLGCACLLIAANYARESWFGRLASSPAVAFAAALSYAVYLFHFTVLSALHVRFDGVGMTALAVMLLVSLAVLVPLSTAAHYGIEKIFLDWKSRLRRAV